MKIGIHLCNLPITHIGLAISGNTLRLTGASGFSMGKKDVTASEEESPDQTHFAEEGETTNTRSYLIGVLLPTSLILLLLILNTLPKEKLEYRSEWEGGNGWEFGGYAGTTAEFIWVKTIEIDPNEDASYTYILSDAPGTDLDYCTNMQTMNSNYTLTCGGNTDRTGFPEGIWVTGEDYRDRIKIGQYTEENKTLWFKPLADTGVTYKIQVEVIEIETFSWLGVANILGFLLLIGMLGFAFKTYRETENSEHKPASEGILAVAKVGSLAAVLAVLGIFLLSLFIGYVAFSTI